VGERRGGWFWSENELCDSLPSFGTPAPAAAGGLDAGGGNASGNKRLAKSKGKK